MLKYLAFWNEARKINTQILIYMRLLNIRVPIGKSQNSWYFEIVCLQIGPKIEALRHKTDRRYVNVFWYSLIKPGIWTLESTL